MEIIQLAKHVQTLALQSAGMAERAQAVQEQMKELFTVNHAQTCAIAALAETHPNRGLALKEFRRIWRTSLPASMKGKDAEPLPNGTLQTLDVLAKALGGSRFEGPEI